MPIVWDQSMATGEATIDEQHRVLISWLNDLLAAMGQGKGRSEIERVLQSLGEYTVMHFGHEEACFQRLRCPAAAENAAAHREFIRIFSGFKAEFETSGPTSDLVLRVKQELAHWVATHIRRTDVKIQPCLTAVRPS